MPGFPNKKTMFIKRMFDVFVSLTLIIMLLPLFFIIALLIKLDSKGPVFFRQKRGGWKNRDFTIFKFRTMKVCDASEKKEFEPGGSSRITSTGAILRKTKLDEIPQLFNVFRGEMSLVGPRPEVRKYISFYPERWDKILSVRPGITDPASIVFRNEEELLLASDDPEKEYVEVIMPKKMAEYEKYVSDISLINDVKIIIATIFAVVFK